MARIHGRGPVPEMFRDQPGLQITDDEMRQVMHPPEFCGCGSPYDMRRKYDTAGTLVASARICGRCGHVERYFTLDPRIEPDFA